MGSVCRMKRVQMGPLAAMDVPETWVSGPPKDGVHWYGSPDGASSLFVDGGLIDISPAADPHDTLTHAANTIVSCIEEEDVVGDIELKLHQRREEGPLAILFATVDFTEGDAAWRTYQWHMLAWTGPDTLGVARFILEVPQEDAGDPFVASLCASLAAQARSIAMTRRVDH